MLPRALPLLLAALCAAACQPAASRRGTTVLFASGADLQSINPLLTLHPLARQVQRYVLLTTLARYDSALVPRPYLAREWGWSDDDRTLTFRLHTALRWHDGRPTTARDVAWTLTAALAPATGYPRLTELADLASVTAEDDSTVTLRFRSPQRRFPDVLTDLAILPAHLLDSVPPGRLRAAAWNARPVGNGPFRFVAHEANRRWVFAADSAFPAVLGGPPRLARLIVVVVDEPTTKLAALASGELDFAGIQPAHASFVRRDPALAVITYPLLFTYGIVLNTRRPPFDRLEVRRRLSAAIDRREIVEGYLYGFGSPADGPVPPDVPGHLPLAPAPDQPSPAAARPAMLPVELLTVGSGEAALEQMVQARLRAAGFDVAIRQLELSAFLARVYGPGREFDAAVLGVPGDPGLGHLAALAELAGMAAPEGAGAAQRFFADSMPVAFLYHARGLQGMNRRVRGVRMDLRGELATVHEWWVAP
ncbi:MAG TPA: ABC transporter substrate-binding protein [Gemmatimonadales bacterium]|nr:ABC transporter substrate-binding protein [Gemmatimonadales bacterium]